MAKGQTGFCQRFLVLALELLVTAVYFHARQELQLIYFQTGSYKSVRSLSIKGKKPCAEVKEMSQKKAVQVEMFANTIISDGAAAC